MIYFIKNVVTNAVKIGYSKSPKKRLGGLQSATPDKLVLLGNVQGGLEHEARFHELFVQYHLQGEWFGPGVLPAVLDLLAKETANPQQQKINVIVSGDSEFSFGTLHNPANRVLVTKALDELHAKTPIAWVITGGDRDFECLSWEWAKRNNVEVYRRFPNWRSGGRFAPFKIGPKLLRTQFDPKVLLIFVCSKVSPSTQSLIRNAEKLGIPVVQIHERAAPSQT
jgi:hypothetical protein